MRDTSHPPKGLAIWTAIAHPVSLLVGVVSLSIMLAAGVGLLMDSADGAANMTTSAAIAAGVAALLYVIGRQSNAEEQLEEHNIECMYVVACYVVIVF